MRLKTLLNKCYSFKSFVYKNARIEGCDEVIVKVDTRKNSKPICGECHHPGTDYDRQPERRFEFIPIWGFHVYLSYAPRRVDCRRCGSVVTEAMPWAEGKRRQTLPLLAFLASWAEEIPWQRVATRFRTSWQSVYRAVEWVVAYGLSSRELGDVEAIGVDEIKYLKGHKYLTVVYQLDAGCRRLLWVGRDRTKKCFEQFFAEMENLNAGFCQGIRFICSDMWKAYLKVAAKRIPQAVHVLDRFHIRKQFSDAVDKTRRQEASRLKKTGKEPVLAKSRWCFLKKRGCLTRKQRSKLKELLGMNLRTVKAYLLTEEFEHFWTYKSVTWAKKFLAQWTRKTMYSKIEPMKGVAKMLRRHEELILNWFRARGEISNGISEGFNTNAKLAFRKARGFRSESVVKTALYHQLGKLPKPTFEHDFW